MDKGSSALAPTQKPTQVPAPLSRPRVSLSADARPTSKDPPERTNMASTTDSQRSKSDTKSGEQTVTEKKIPDTEGMSNVDFVNTLLLRLLRAKVVDDSKTDRRNSESLEDGPPSRADVTIAAKEIVRLTEIATTVLLNDKCLLRIDKSVLPLLIIGDIHGQFIHLRSLFEMFGGPMETSLLFLGDYVDRGVQGVECMCLLLAMKIKYPGRVFLLRGNHEDANTTLSYGFHEECLSKYKRDAGKDVWLAFVGVFNVMPLAAIVNRKIFCVHGGLSPHMERVEEIDKIVRPSLIPAFGLATDLVWADPGAKHPGWSLSPRGVSFNFCSKAVDDFCKRNAIDLIVRGHQISSDMHNTGYKFHCSGRLVTIFSAPNYLNYHNAAAVMKVGRDMTCSMTVFRSSEAEEDDERVKKQQFLKSRQERRKARKAPTPGPGGAPAPATPTPSQKKESIEDPDTSTGSVSEEDQARELSARDIPEPDHPGETGTAEKKTGDEKSLKAPPK